MNERTGGMALILHLIIHTLVAMVITWIGLIVIIVADVFSWPYFIGCLLAGILIAIPITYFIANKEN